MHKDWIIGLVLAVMMGGIAGCCSDPEEYHYPLPASLLSNSGYQLGTSITMRQTASGPYIHLQARDLRHDEVLVDGCVDCCAKEYEDVYAVVLQADSTAMQIAFELRQGGSEGTYYPPILAITVNTNGVFYTDLDAIGGCSLDPTVPCIDSMLIADRPYYGVMALTNKGSSQAAEVADSLYYNAAHGILRITTHGVGAWDLVR